MAILAAHVLLLQCMSITCALARIACACEAARRRPTPEAAIDAPNAGFPKRQSRGALETLHSPKVLCGATLWCEDDAMVVAAYDVEATPA